MKKYEMPLTPRQDILEYDRRFTIHTLQPLLQVLGDHGKLGHEFIEPLRILARDGLVRPASFRRESPEMRFLRGLSIHSLGRSVGWSENKNKGEARNRRSRKRTYPST